MQRSRERGPGPFCGRAEEAYREALKRDPDRLAAIVGMAWVCNTRHEFEQGRAWAERALEIAPGNADAHALLGDAAVEYGDYDRACEHYQAALDGRPDLSSYSRAAHLLWITGNPQRAKLLMRKAIAAGAPHAENTAWCRAELALMMFHDGMLLPAEHELRQALIEAPGNPHALAALGRVQAARGELEAAILSCEEALASGAPQIRTMAGLAKLHALVGDAAEAERMRRRMLGLGRSDPSAPRTTRTAGTDPPRGSVELARYLADDGRDLDRALAEATAAYEAFPNVYAADALAWCSYRAGDSENAQRFMDEALRWNTPDASFLYHAGMVHAALGNREAAKTHLYRALNLNPHFDPQAARTAAETLKALAARPNTTDDAPSPVPAAASASAQPSD